MKNELKNTSKLVKEILESNEDARDSDDKLYLLVCEKYGYNAENISLEDFLIRRKDFDLPSYPSVSRARRKVQEHCEELRGSNLVRGYREDLEVVFENYSRNTNRATMEGINEQ